ncbi:MAG: DUF4199 domain-containing protein [Coprobacter sp.]|nr:DUF4199 domain-containing protein [Coprobacter sp.]
MTDQPKKTLSRYAMEYGVYVGGYLILMFACVVWSQYSVIANLMGTAMLVSVPAILYIVMRHYVRAEADVRFARLWLLGIFVFFFASLISGFAQYIYFEYINPDWIPSLVEQQLALLEAMGSQSPEMAELADVLRTGVDNGVSFAPIDVVFMMMWWNVFTGSILSLFVALFARISNRQKS